MDLELTAGDALGSYEIIEMLGRGGMGTVYKAMHTGLERVVALKILSSHLTAEHNRFVSRFLLEAKTAAKVSHSNIVNIYDSGSISGKYFISSSCCGIV